MTARLLPYTPDRDAYRLLGVPPTASTEEIGLACRRLARSFHPDVNRSERATEEMQVVNVVRQVLTDPAWRATYDRERHRFHAQLGRPRKADPASEPVLRLETRPAAVLHRYGRALGIGLRTTVAALAPRRCAGCRMVLEAPDAYCPACGRRA